MHTVTSPTSFRAPFLCLFVLAAYAAWAEANSQTRPQTIYRAVCASTADINNLYVHMYYVYIHTHIKAIYSYPRSFDQLFCLTVARSNDHTYDLIMPSCKRDLNRVH